MKNLTFCCIMLLAGCGGSDNGPVDVQAPQYQPSQETWEQATELFARGIETSDVEAIRSVLAPGEKDRTKGFEENFKKSEENDVTWRIHYEKALELDDDRTAVQVWYYQTQNGQEKVTQKHWMQFIRVDELWYYSPKTTKEFVDELEAQAKKQQESKSDGDDTDEESPNNNDKPADAPGD